MVTEVDLGDSGKWIRRVVNGWEALFYLSLFYLLAGFATEAAVTFTGLGLAVICYRNFDRYGRKIWRTYTFSVVLTILTLAFLVGMYANNAMRRDGDLLEVVLTSGVFAAVVLAIPIRGLLAVPHVMRRTITPSGSALMALVDDATSANTARPGWSSKFANARCVVCAIATLAVGTGLAIAALLLLPAVVREIAYLDGASTQFEEQLLFIGVGLAFFFFLFVCSLAWRFMQTDAERLMSTDPRAPVVLFRSFADDAIQMPTKRILPGFLRSVDRGGNPQVVDYTRARSTRLKLWEFSHLLDEALADELSRYGPFISIGEPGEIAPLLGSAKTYRSGESWQATVGEWIERAGVIVLVAGRSEGVRWELREIIARNRHEDLLLVLAPNDFEERYSRWHATSKEFDATKWGAALTCVRIADVRVAILQPEGRVQVIRTEDEHTIDYEIALRLAMNRLLEQRAQSVQRFHQPQRIG